MIKRLALVVLAAMLLGGSSGCCCLEQFFCCVKKRWCGCCCDSCSYGGDYGCCGGSGMGCGDCCTGDHFGGYGCDSCGGHGGYVGSHHGHDEFVVEGPTRVTPSVAQQRSAMVRKSRR